MIRGVSVVGESERRQGPLGCIREETRLPEGALTVLEPSGSEP